MNTDGKLSPNQRVRLDGLLRCHMHWAYEPLRFIRADGQQRQPGWEQSGG